MITSKNKLFKKLIVAMLFLVSSVCINAQPRGITLETVKPNKTATVTDGQYRALIIGNDQYRDSKGKWPSLKTAVTDAKALRAVLKENYGFIDIKLLENATRRDVLVELDLLSKRVLKNDHVLVYYAGHGYVDSESQKGYWVPVDAEGTDQTTFLRNSTIRDEMTVLASRAKHTLLISDSCFSGTLLRRGNRGIRSDLKNEKYYQKVLNKKSVQIMSAGGVEYVDDEYNSTGHSPFSHFLLSELKNNDQPLLTLSELSSNVTKAVANNVDQVPESGVLQGAGDELGEFVFIKVDVKVSGIPKEKVKVKVNVISDDNKSTDVKVESSPESLDKKSSQRFTPIPTL
ncbi:MAG: caspase domain-containing protein [Gammaproteobacteria bacterium]